MRDRERELEQQRVRVHVRARHEGRLILVAVALLTAGAIAFVATREGRKTIVVRPGNPAVEASARTEQVRADALSGLEAQRATLRSQCWEPSVARSPKPASVTLTFDYTFDAGGAQIAQGIAEDRSAYRTDVTECVRNRVQPVHVRAPGTNYRVFVPFTLP